MTEDLSPTGADLNRWARSVLPATHLHYAVEAMGGASPAAVEHRELPRAEVLGLKVSAITFADALAAIDAFVRSRTPH